MVNGRLLTAMFVAGAVLAGLGGWAHADWVDEVTASNPLNWWRFEEEVGATVAADIGSENWDGNYTNDVALQQPGVVGMSAGFDGVDDYVFLGAENVADDWSVEVIFEAGPGGASQGLIGGTNPEPNSAIKAEQWNETGNLGYTNFGVIDITLPVPTPSEFAHVVFVQTAAGVELYVDGVAVASDATTMELSREVIGGGNLNDTGGLGDPLDGLIDELVIYDRPLSSDEIMDHFNSIVDRPVVVPGDVNLDGIVNGLDVDPFVDVLLNGPYQAEADMNEDTEVNGLDVDPFVEAVVGGGVAAVPEPSTLLLLAMGLLAIAAPGAWQRRRQ
jgi:hypothetical protein